MATKNIDTSEKIAIIINYGPEEMRKILATAGSHIGSVKFKKRTNGEIRKMTYRLSVTNPKYAQKPSGKKKDIVDGNSIAQKTLITVFDTNKVVRNKNEEIIGRGAWRTIPLDSILEVKAGGIRYIVGDYSDSKTIKK